MTKMTSVKNNTIKVVYGWHNFNCIIL